MVSGYHGCSYEEDGRAKIRRKDSEHPRDAQISSAEEQPEFTHRAHPPAHRCMLDRPSSRVPILRYLQLVHTTFES